MKSFIRSIYLFCLLLLSCAVGIAQKPLVYEGAFQSGYRDTRISFVVSPDGRQLSELTFTGNIKCDSAVQQVRVNTGKSLPIVDGKVDGIISDPEDGGSAAWHFEIHGFVLKGKSTGTFRLNNTNLGCDTHKLKWGAALQQ